MTRPRDRHSGLAVAQAQRRLEAPALPYEPRDPRRYGPNLGLIGCGGITKQHLTAYRNAGYRVAALCDIDPLRARKRKTEFYPDAKVYANYLDLLKRDDIEVVDIATHPAQRIEIVESSLRAGKHVLSQKPFVLDLDCGQRLVDLADRQGVRLAVNQNARWAPHFSYTAEAIRAGLLGEVMSVHAAVHWDHSWVKGTEFEKLKHLILYDYGIHWFDIVACLFGGQPVRRVYASTCPSPVQKVAAPLLAQCLIEYDAAQASLVFDGHTRFGTQDHTWVIGSQATVHSTGPDAKRQTVTLATTDGQTRPDLKGCWFPDGFHGTMGELLCAIEEDREPTHSARNNLRSLELCFAAVASAQRHEPVLPGTVRAVPE